MTNSLVAKIKLAGVTKSFGENHALQGASLEVAEGESLVLIGGSGSGKTLLLKCILGLIEPDSGSIFIDGQETIHLSESARLPIMDRFGILFQRSALFDSMSVWENVAFRLLQRRGVRKAEARDIAIQKLISVGLSPDVGALLPAELSGGMQKRVGLARAIAADPEIIFLDEPTAGLDPIMSNIINDLIIKNVRELGATALSINSDMVGARRISDHMAMIHEGRILWSGLTSEVDDSGNAYVDQFINNRAEGPIKMALKAF
jgi:phospholipid/cholesterol/gamma-HCH transport system ATP-binding protein